MKVQVDLVDQDQALHLGGAEVALGLEQDVADQVRDQREGRLIAVGQRHARDGQLTGTHPCGEPIAIDEGT